MWNCPRNLTAQIGKRELESSEGGRILGRYTMSAPAYIERGVTMIELVPVMKALGGTVQFKKAWHILS